MKERSVLSIARSLGKLSARWMDRGFIFRRKAIQRLVRVSGYSENMSQAMLDAVFSELSEAKLLKLLKSEFKDPLVLDGFKRDETTGTYVRARGPKSILHIFSADSPQAAILSFVLGMLLKSHNFGRSSSRDAGFLGIYLDSLKRADRALWRTNTLLAPTNRTELAKRLRLAELVAAYGGDESLEQIRKKVPATTPFFAYGHRISAALYLKETLSRKNAVLAARDVWMADQRGCLSPVTVYAQKGGPVSPKEFAGTLATELRRLNREKVPVRRGLSAAMTAHVLRNVHLVKTLKGDLCAHWESSPRGLWTVLYEEDLKVFLAASPQVIRVQGFRQVSQVLSVLQPLRKYLQCVSLECAVGGRKALAEKLSALGVNRVCRAGKMQHPPVTWHHDGKPNLASWVRWTDLE